MTEGPVEALHQNILVILRRERGLREALKKITHTRHWDMDAQQYCFGDPVNAYSIAKQALEEFPDPGDEFVKKHK